MSKLSHGKCKIFISGSTIHQFTTILKVQGWGLLKVQGWGLLLTDSTESFYNQRLIFIGRSPLIIRISG